MSTFRAWALPINPFPWAVGKATAIPNRGRKPFVKIAPDKALRAYQDAVQAELLEMGVTPEPGLYSIRFTFSRQLEQYMTVRGKQTGNAADSTNMQKATEDALQGVAIENDRQTISIVSHLASESKVSTIPYVVIEVLSGIDGYEMSKRVLPGQWISQQAIEARNQMMRTSAMNPEIINNTFIPE